MTWFDDHSEALTTDEVAWAADDKPIIGSNSAFGVLSSAKWIAGILGDLGDVDIADSDYPISRLFDGLPGLATTPASAETGLTLCFDFGSAGIDFDGVLIINQNMDTQGASIVTVEIASDSLFTADLDEIGSLSVSDDARLADLSLEHGGDPQRYTGIRYIRLNIVSAGDTQPSIGQVIFLRRRQLKRNPDRPWDPTNQASRVDVLGSIAGTDYATVRYRGKRSLQASLGYLDADQQAEILAWWAEIDEGVQSFIWVDDPNTTPRGFNLMRLDDPVLQFPFVTPTDRSLSLDATEQGPPFLSRE